MENLYMREALSKFTCAISLKEKADKIGFENLLDGELLMLATDLAEEKIQRIHDMGILDSLGSVSYEEWIDLVGKSKARKLSAALELARRILNQGLGIPPVISCPLETVPFLTEIKDKEKEYFLCLYLNARHQVIHKEIVSIGSLSASIVHPREVFSVAVEYSAASIILSHNHPSGTVDPSQDDIELTRRLVKAGEILGIEVLDHIIIGNSDYFSLKERELM